MVDNKVYGATSHFHSRFELIEVRGRVRAELLVSSLLDDFTFMKDE